MKTLSRALAISLLTLLAALPAIAQPANNNFSDAWLLTGTTVTTNGNSTGATKETGEPNHAGFTGGRSVWFVWTAPVSAATRINTIGSGFNTLLGVYTGNAVNSLTQIAANDNIGGGNTASQVQFQTVQGTTYHIAIDGRNNFGGGASSGPYVLNLQVLSAIGITSPTNGSLFAAGAPINITADVVGFAATRVDFYRGTTLLGSATTSPYSFSWTNAPLGSNSLSAVAVDGSGGTLTSATINIAVLSPGITIVDPADGTYIANTNSISVSAVGLVASGAITNVDFYVDKNFFASDGAAPFSGAWSPITGGVHAFTAIGKDTAGILYTSAPVYVSVPLIIVPSNSVWKYLDTGVDLGNTWITPSFDDSSWAAGPAELGYGDETENPPRPEATVVGYGPDPFNKYITTYFRTSFVVTNSGRFTNLVVSVMRDDGAVVYLNGVEVDRSNMPEGPITFTTVASANAADDGTIFYPTNVPAAALVEGTNVLAVEIHQANIGSSDLSFDLQLAGLRTIVRNAFPLVALTNPAPNTAFVGAAPIVLDASASDTDGSVVEVDFLVDGVAIGRSTNSPYSATWTNVTIGFHSLQAAAIDDQGAVGASAPVAITVHDSSGTPLANITAPANGAVFDGPTNLTLAAIAAAVNGITNVQFFANGTSLGNDISAPYSIVWTNATFGTNRLVAVAYDANGVTGTSSEISIIVNAPPPNLSAPTIATVAPAPGSSLTNLTSIQVTFSERVTGVDASDFLINNSPATSVSGSGSNYVFTFRQPPLGNVSISWVSKHAIEDVGFPPLPFDATAATANWSYTIVDRTPPTIASRVPVAGATITNLTQITVNFSEPVQGVDASDLLINGSPAVSLNGTTSSYTFGFLQPAAGTVNISWAGNHGISDLASPPNAFNATGTGATWTYLLDNRTTLIQSNSTWLFIKAFAEASTPIDAWRFLGFDDSSWSNSLAPFYYGDPYNSAANPGTLLSDMLGGAYSSIYLRKAFSVQNASAVTNLFLNAQCDDGFIAWINGVEVLRYNMDPGDIPYNGSAPTTANEPNQTGAAYILYSISPSSLVEGTNVLAVHAFNNSPATSSDFGFNAQLYTFVADSSLVPPRVQAVTPLAGGVFYLTNITVKFTEAVSGVTADDLLINGIPANAVSGGASNDVFTFSFSQPPYGTAAITWNSAHGIADFDSPPKPFDATAAGSTWQYSLINPSAPTIAAAAPTPNASVSNLSQVAVTFNELVTGVDASDLLVNGVPAATVSGNGATYTFGFSQPAYGLVSIGWAANHGIHDLDIPSNDFDGARPGNSWTYSLVDLIPPTIASVNPLPGSQVTNLTQLTVTFSEPVSGVDAADLRINGVAAVGVTGLGATYTFSFAQPGSTIVNITWAGTHGIRDLATTPNPFNSSAPGATWFYTTPDTLAPTVAQIDPPAFVTLRSLRDVRIIFSEPVTGVDTNDLLINGHPALRVSGSGVGPYTFSFLQPPAGPIELRWSATSGIQDLANPANAFAGGEWNYILDPNASFAGKVLINEIMFNAPGGRATDEWIELLNVSSNLINLAGWQFTKGAGFTFPNVSIAGGAYLVVAADLASFQSRYPGVTNVIGGWTGQLANTDETIELTSALGEVVNNVHYATEGDWARRERGHGAQRISSITRAGSTATVTIFNHGYANNDQVIISGADQPEYNGRFTVSNPGVSTFNITISGTPATPATGALISRQVLNNGSSGWSWFAAADGLGSSVELLNPALPNDSGQNWAASIAVSGTPGKANSVRTNDLPPLVLDVKHFPPVPTSSDAVAITARVSDESGIQNVTLFYRNHSSTSPTAFSSVSMLDDGAHGDGIGNDGLFGAVLPPAANGTVIEFYVQATDITAHVRTWPAPAWETNNTTGQFANALYQVDNEAINNLMPALRVVLSGTERAIFPPNNRNSDASMNATMISTDGDGTQVRYLCGVRIRGAGTRTRTPPNNRLDIPNDNRWNGLKGVNLNSQFVHAQLAGNVLAQKSGLPASDAHVIQYRINGVNPAPLTPPSGSSGAGYGTFLMIQPVNGDLAANLYPQDGAGNVYRASTGNHNADLGYSTDLNNYLSRGYYKTSNQSENDWSDLQSLTFAFTQVTPDTDYVRAISTNVNVVEWMRYFAVASLMNDGETKLGNGIGDDYAMYRGDTDRRFVVLGHDFDTIFGQGDTGPTYYPINTNSSIFLMLNPPNGNANVTALRRFMMQNEFAPLFYSELKRLCDTVFSPAQLNPLMDQLLSNWGSGPSATTISDMKTYAANRRAVALSQIPLTLTVGSSLGTSNGLLYTTSANVTLSGSTHAIDTRKVLVNGSEATWSAWQARWTNTLALRPGVNRVIVQSLDSNNVAFASVTVDVWYDAGAAATTVSGTLAGAPTWTAAAGPYAVTGNLTIPNGVTLTIQPGTTVYIASGATITINGSGRILAEGTDAQHIRFTRNPTTAGNWGSLDFINSTVESRLAYIDFDSCGGTTIGGHNSQLHVNNSIIFIDHCTWPSTPVVEFISFDGSSFIVQNCYFPSYPPPTGPESLHGVNGIPVTGYGIFRDNYFGHTWGFNDTIDFTGGNRPGAILQIINNVFDGASDDHLDLDSTDAWIEGNIFMHAHRDPTRTDNALDTSSAISGGVDNIGQNPDWTIINNIFYDVDHVFLNKGNSTTVGNGGGRVAFLYNTVIHVAREYSGSTAAEISVFNWSDDSIALPDASLGSGMYAAYNIIYDYPALQRLYDPAHHTVILDNNILSTPWTGPGSGNQVVDPMLNLGVLAGTAPTNVTVAQLRQAARLRPGSPAIGAGFGGLDLGGFQPNGIAIEGEPEGITASTGAILTVGPGGTFNWGTTTPQQWGWTAFKWKLDDGPFSAEIPFANNSPFTNLPTITLSDLSNGPHTVYVVGKNDAPRGYYQDDPFVYPPTAGFAGRVTASRTWVVDTSRLDVRLNEILTSNNRAVDHNGTTPDLIELYNTSAGDLDLSGVGLTDDISAPAKFLFPQGTTLPGGAYLVVYANNPDGTPGFHLGFNLAQESGAVYLFNSSANGGALLDSVEYGSQLTDLSIGRMNDGSWALNTPTFGGPNRRAPLGDSSRLKINEWLAIAQSPFNNDFIELYNPDPLPVDLGGLYLSDEIVGWPDRHRISPLTFVAGSGYFRFFADGSPGQGAEHLNFHLSGAQGAIGLYQQDRSAIDVVMYQPQLPNVSQGRSPNGSATIIFFDQPTPGAPNPIANINPNGGALVINEVLASNSSFPEPGGRTPDWIELYNGTATAINLADLSVTDDSLQPRKFVFAPGIQLSSGGYLRLLCDDGQPAATNNTAFALKSSGGTVYLFDSLANGGSLLNAITFGLQITDFSIARVPNGSTNWVLAIPTAGGANSPVPSLGDPLNLRVNEWMAAPSSGNDWFEIFNPNNRPVALGGLHLTDDLNNRTKDTIPALSFIGSGTNAWQQFLADNNTGAGADHVSFSLRGSGEAVAVSTSDGTLIDGYAFGPQLTGVSEGRFPDGSTNIVTFPNTDSPGQSNYRLLTDVVISEVLTHTDAPLEDAIELQNLTGQPIDVSGWWLSDDKGTLQKYQIPAGHVVPPFGFAVFYESQFTNRNVAAVPFALSSHGDETVLSAATNNALTGYRTSVKFGAADNGVSFGRYLNSAGEEQFTAMKARSFGIDDPANAAEFEGGTGLSNAYPRVGPVVISEITYHPPDLPTGDNARDEFIELRNISTVPVPLFDPAYPTNVWHIRDGVDFDFPAGTVLDPGTSLLIVGFDPVNDAGTLAAFRAAYHLDISTRILGPYAGKLANDNEDIEVRKPGTPDLDGVPYILVEHVHYADTAPWAADADGTGLSLQRVSDTGYGNDPTNWVAAVPTPGPQSSTLDSDGDGIPDAWEISHNFDPYNPADALLDSDNDGLSNLQEFRAGTDPRSASSVLRLASISASGGQNTNIHLSFQAAANQSYSLLWKESIDAGKWTKLSDWSGSPAAGPSDLLDPLPRVASRIYRLVTPAIPGPANPLPAILSSPKSAIIDFNGEITFQVDAIGNGPLTYQWLFNDLPLPNSTGSTLTISNAQFSNAGPYSVRVSDSSNNDLSSPAYLAVKPHILSQPQGQTANANATVTLNVSAEGAAPLTYRWRFNGHPMANETNSTLVLPNVQPSNSGNYSVTVSQSYSWTRSSTVSSNAAIVVSP